MIAYTYDTIHTLLITIGVVFSVFFVIGGVNMAVGTLSYLYNITKLRKKMMLSSPAWILIVCLATVHFLLWLVAVFVYLTIVEEELSDDIFKDEPWSKV